MTTPPVERGQNEPQECDQKDYGEPVHKAEPIRVGVVVDPSEVNPADEDEYQEEHEAGTSHPRGSPYRSPKAHLSDYT